MYCSTVVPVSYNVLWVVFSDTLYILSSKRGMRKHVSRCCNVQQQGNYDVICHEKKPLVSPMITLRIVLCIWPLLGQRAVMTLSQACDLNRQAATSEEKISFAACSSPSSSSSWRMIDLRGSLLSPHRLLQLTVALFNLQPVIEYNTVLIQLHLLDNGGFMQTDHITFTFN